jgi:hypothetical protein
VARVVEVLEVVADQGEPVARVVEVLEVVADQLQLLL